MGNPFKGVWTLDASRPAVWQSNNPSATMTFPWGGVQAQVILPPGQRATITVTAWVKLGLPLPTQPEDYQQLVATTVLDSQAPSMTGLCAVPSGGSNWTLSKIALPLLAMLAAMACMIFAGCAHMGSSTQHNIVTYNLDPATGKTNSIQVDVGGSRLFGFSMLDSNQALQKAKNQSGYSRNGTNNTFAPGSYIGGLNQSSTSTNLIQALKILEALAAAGAL